MYANIMSARGSGAHDNPYLGFFDHYQYQKDHGEIVCLTW